MRCFLLYTDGGSRNNPGPAATGWVIRDVDGEVVKKGGSFLGKATNNEAEYRAIIEGLTVCHSLEPCDISCYLDSALVVNQINGHFKVKEPRLRKLLDELHSVEAKLKASISYEHIPRSKNRSADAIVNQILDKYSN